MQVKVDLLSAYLSDLSPPQFNTFFVTKIAACFPPCAIYIWSFHQIQYKHELSVGSRTLRLISLPKIIAVTTGLRTIFSLKFGFKSVKTRFLQLEHAATS